MNKQALAFLLYRELSKVYNQDQIFPVHQAKAIYRLMNVLLLEITKDERIHFSTIFARMAYVGHKYNLSRKLQYFAHLFRRRINTDINEAEKNHLPLLGAMILVHLIKVLLEEMPPEPLQYLLEEEWPVKQRKIDIQSFLPKVRVIALEDKPEASILLVKTSKEADQLLEVQYNIPDRNENFNPTIDIIRQHFGFPVILNLIDVEVDQDGIYRPAAFVVESDYLIDVTAVAECFRNYGTDPYNFLLKRFLQVPANKYILLGHIANFFLDELIHNPNISFKELFPRVFQLNPLGFCLLEDGVIREIMQKAQLHYVNLRQIILRDFPAQGIKPEGVYLEPSFFAESYGLQGRLDLLFNDGEKIIITELKSGKPFKPNAYGLSRNHFTQTLLYDLMIRDVFKSKIEPVNYILYSGIEDRQLRFAPRIKAQQYEALQIRNQLVAIERQIAQLGLAGEEMLKKGDQFFSKLFTHNYPNIKGFVLRDLSDFEQTYRRLLSYERAYFIAFSSFIAREHQLAKVGEHGLGTNNGLASLWLDDFKEKEESFEIISHLKIKENLAAGEEPLVIFNKTEHTNNLANFRKGDIAVLYPFTGKNNAVLSNQIFKCTIIEITNSQVIARLRSRQTNDHLFETVAYWNLEHDLLDSSFIGMYRALFEWAKTSPAKRKLLLGMEPPKQLPPLQITAPKGLTAQQGEIFKQLMAAEDYFLLWGPPGTGKTSVMLRAIVKYILEETNESILLLAYTNRAVDEICESIESIGEHVKKDYFRIGSRYSTSPAFSKQLLNAKTAGVQTRKDLMDIIKGHRIIVSTVTAITSRPELFKIKKIDRVIIDEASQILEPLLAGLLTRFPKFILIGDHKQLPAVVTQRKEDTIIEDTALNQLGLKSCANSLFERLFMRCKKMNWTWAYAQLSHQGRMHKEIMDFPNQQFYESTLYILPSEISAHRRQLKKLVFQNSLSLEGLPEGLCRDRMIFIPTPADDLRHGLKTNLYEAKKVGELVQYYHQLYEMNEMEMRKNAIGIITPFRAQIAQIRHTLTQLNIDPETLTIDTVERYQGGARDIIIISLCTNTLSQLSSISSLSEEGVDRKLNVALTRAREQLIILGNPDLLKYQDTYFELIRFCDALTEVTPES